MARRLAHRSTQAYSRKRLLLDPNDAGMSDIPCASALQIRMLLFRVPPPEAARTDSRRMTNKLLPETLRTWRYRLFYKVLLENRGERLRLGKEAGGCSWTICPTGLTNESVVYTGGVGNDVSFETELVGRYGCRIVLCDPSPTGARTMALPQNRIPQFTFVQAALANRHGKIQLAAPLNPEGDWWLTQSPGVPATEFPCIDLRTLMLQNGHDHIDLLKLDIEGSEYAVIDDLLARRLSVTQLCVEFHHGVLPGVRRSQSIRAMFKLLRNGYCLIDQHDSNHTFILREHLRRQGGAAG